MIFNLVTTDKRVSGKAAWAIYIFSTLLICALGYYNHWPDRAMMTFFIGAAVMTFLTFSPKCPPKLQSICMMLFFFSDVYIVSVMERNIYSTLYAYLGVSILLAIYLNERLVFAYSILVAGAILSHMFVLRTLRLDTSVQIIEFIVKISIVFLAMFFLMVFLRRMNQNRKAMEESVEEAQQAEQYKSDFLANMSHEIRTPMNAIIGMCELILREDTLSVSAQENCFNIQASGKSLLSIINDILDYSKIDSGQMEIIEEEFNIASIINDVLNMSEARRGSKKIKLQANIDPNIPIGLLGDEIRIRQIMLNLMTNAIKFTEKGTVTLDISFSMQDYGVNLVVSVKDTGIGITEENIEKLFTSFRQVNTKKNRSIEGTGLGLAISKNLVRQMGGFISVKSKYGAGSEFRFVIPLYVSDSKPFVSIKDPDTIHAAACLGDKESAGEDGHIFLEMGRKLGVDFKCFEHIGLLKEQYAVQKPTHIFVSSQEYLKDVRFFENAVKDTQIFVIQDRVETEQLPDDIQRVYSPFYVIPVVSAINRENIVLNLNERRNTDIHFTAPNAKVLIVDDNMMNLKVAMGLMRPYNMQILTAVSGAEAIKMLESKDFDLVFMDHMMPVMDGVEATAIIRSMEDEYYKNLHIIALTANVANDARSMFLNSGFDDFLAKPIELSAIDRVLRNYLPKEYLQAPERTEHLGSYEKKKNREGENSMLLDVEKGISYMGGSEETYREILSIYAHEGADKLELIRRLFEKNDMQSYVIEVHALKSTSMNIGAVRLSELAKELEAAGKAGKPNEFMKEKNEELLGLYSEVINAVLQYLAQNGLQHESAVTTDLTEIPADMLNEYIVRAKRACQGFDSDTVVKIAGETCGYAFEGEPLKAYFEKAAQLAMDFEYETAEQELEKLVSKLKA